MRQLANQDIRKALEESGIKQWELAERMGYSPSHFSTKMRHEFSSEEKLRCLSVIEEMAFVKSRSKSTYVTICIESFVNSLEDKMYSKNEIEQLLRRFENE